MMDVAQDAPEGSSSTEGFKEYAKQFHIVTRWDEHEGQCFFLEITDISWSYSLQQEENICAGLVRGHRGEGEAGLRGLHRVLLT